MNAPDPMPLHGNRAAASHGGAKASCRGLTLVEILVVVVLGTLVIGGGVLLWGRTGRTVVKGEEMMDLQLALRAINERLRSDVRTLTSVQSCNAGRLAFLARQKGREVKIQYEFDDTARSLLRKAEGSPDTDFQATGLVSSVAFSARPSVTAFETLHLALELQSKPRKGTPATRLAVVNQFSSRSLEPPFETVR